jgi:hypothetical protein
MLLFGLRNRTYWTTRIDALCTRCSAWHTHNVGVVKTKLAFFLIPLIPIGSERVVACTNCKQKTIGRDADRFIDFYTVKK